MKNISKENEHWEYFIKHKQKIMSFIKLELEKEEFDDGGPSYLKYFDISNGSFRFMPSWLAKDIHSSFSRFFNDGRILFRYKDGKYINDGETYFRSLSQELLMDESKRGRIEEALYWLKNETVSDEGSVLNKHDGLINVKNGLVNYKTGEIVSHTDDRISTVQFPVTYDPEANDEVVMKFLESVLPSDTIETMLELIGYCLVPTTKYEKAFMFSGTGANGKSTFVNMLSTLLGKENVSNVPLQDLENNRFKSAQLYGKMANIFADIAPTALDKSSVFKSIVSGDSISAEYKGKDSFDFRPFAKLIFSANELPATRDITDGFFRRWIIIPFPNQFKKNEADPNLIHKLTTPEAQSTLLNYAIQGLNRLEANGHFTESETIHNLLNDYKKESDSVSTFIEEKCDLGAWGECTSTKELFEVYEKWCVQMGYQIIKKRDFNKRLEGEYKLNKTRKFRSSSESWEGIAIHT
ncbi:DNA primase family protein [Sutcliffiella halmapala]